MHYVTHHNQTLTCTKLISASGGPKKTKMNLFGPKWTALDLSDFGTSVFDRIGCLDHVGHFGAVPRLAAHLPVPKWEAHIMQMRVTLRTKTRVTLRTCYS